MCQTPPKEGKTTKFWKDIKVVSALQKSNCNCVTHTALDWQQLQKANFAAVWGWHQNHISPTLPILFSNGTWGQKKQIQRLRDFALPSLQRNITFSSVCAGKKTIFLPASVSSRALKFSSHGFMDHIDLPYLFFLKEQLLFHSQVCQSLISVCFQRKWGFFFREAVFSKR